MPERLSKLPNTIACTVTAVPRSCGDLVVGAVGAGTPAVPGFEDGGDGPLQLPARVGAHVGGALVRDRLLAPRPRWRRSAVPSDRRALRPGAAVPPRRSDRRRVRARCRRTCARTGPRCRPRTPGCPSSRASCAAPRQVMPRFSTVSIMPGMLTWAPERTDTSSGTAASSAASSAKRFPVLASSAASARSVWADQVRRQPAAGAEGAVAVGADDERRRHGDARGGHARPGRRPCRRSGRCHRPSMCSTAWTN